MTRPRLPSTAKARIPFFASMTRPFNKVSAPNGTFDLRRAEGMGVATGIAFDAAETLYVGDRSGTIFIHKDRSRPADFCLPKTLAAERFSRFRLSHSSFGPQGDNVRPTAANPRAHSSFDFTAFTKSTPIGRCRVLYAVWTVRKAWHLNVGGMF